MTLNRCYSKLIKQSKVFSRQQESFLRLLKFADFKTSHFLPYCPYYEDVKEPWDAAHASRLHDDNISITVAVRSTLILYGLLDIVTSERGGCGCMTWSVRDENTVNILRRRQEKEKERLWHHQRLSEPQKFWEIFNWKRSEQPHRRDTDDARHCVSSLGAAFQTFKGRRKHECEPKNACTERNGSSVEFTICFLLSGKWPCGFSGVLYGQRLFFLSWTQFSRNTWGLREP